MDEEIRTWRCPGYPNCQFTTHDPRKLRTHRASCTAKRRSGGYTEEDFERARSEGRESGLREAEEAARRTAAEFEATQKRLGTHPEGGMSNNVRYPLAKDGVFWTLQGEGHLRGFQMAFVRLGACPVACPGCDTDYAVAEKAEVLDIVDRVQSVTPSDSRDMWVWITGGEPAAYDLRPLLSALASKGYSTAVATSGYRRIVPPVDWLSVSPHSAEPGQFLQRYGNEIKLVPRLNGLDPWEFVKRWPDDTTEFMYRYVQPLWKDNKEDPLSLADCLAFLKDHPNWALSRQDHHYWRVP